MAGLAAWELVRDLAIACALLAGYAWLAVLSAQVRAIHRRLAAHLCDEPGRHARHRIEAAERTQPMPAINDSEEDFHEW